MTNEIKIDKKTLPNEKVDQWARVIAEDNGNLIVRLLGTGEIREISPKHITGVKVTKNISIIFDPTAINRISIRGEDDKYLKDD